MKNKTHLIISKDTSIQQNLALICDENFQWTRNRKQILHLEKEYLLIGLLRWLSGKESANAGDKGDPGLIPGSERSPGGGNGNPLQDSCLGNSMDRGAWWAPVPKVTKSQTQLNDSTTARFRSRYIMLYTGNLHNFMDQY